MKQNTQKNKLRGAEGFESYYSDIFGERWKSLKKALALDPCYAKWNANGKNSYFLDVGSIRAAISLPLSSAKNILDMCAAPGGKTLVLASVMDKDASLVSNERSPERKSRLVKVCASCLSEELQSRVEVTCSDGAKLCLKKTECYDRILLDAPCSSERHVLADSKYLSEWTPSRIKTVAMEQWALLSSAWRLLVPGGYILYSTCALTPVENDNIIERLLKKFSEAKIVTLPEIFSDDVPELNNFCSEKLPAAERTKYGLHVLPDTQNGAGPLFFSLIYKDSCKN